MKAEKRARNKLVDGKYLEMKNRYALHFIGYMSTAMVYYAHVLFGFGSKRLNRLCETLTSELSQDMKKFCPDTLYVKSRSGRIKAPAEKVNYEACSDYLEWANRIMESFGVKIDWSYFDAPDRTDARRDVNNEGLLFIRQWWYKTAGRQASMCFFAEFVLTMHFEYGFGKQRIEKLIEPIYKDFRALLISFFLTSKEQDELSRRYIRNKTELLAKQNVKWVFTDTDGAELMNTEKLIVEKNNLIPFSDQAQPPKAKDIPEDILRKIAIAKEEAERGLM